MKSTYKNFRSVGLATALVFGLSTQVSAAPLPFTVDPFNAFGVGPGPFVADFINGSSSTLVTLETGGAGTTTSSGHGWVDFSSYSLANLPIGPLTSGLDINYNLWAEFSYTTTLSSGTYTQIDSKNDVNTLHVEFWAEIIGGGDSVFTAATGTGTDASVAHSGDAVKLAFGDILGVGAADINHQGGTGFNATTGFHLTSPEGTSFFTLPVPFHNVAFDEFNNTRQGVTGSLATGFLAINNTSGGVDFNRIPEPTTLVLLGIGLLGFFASMKRRV